MNVCNIFTLVNLTPEGLNGFVRKTIDHVREREKISVARDRYSNEWKKMNMVSMT